MRRLFTIEYPCPECDEVFRVHTTAAYDRKGRMIPRSVDDGGIDGINLVRMHVAQQHPESLDLYDRVAAKRWRP